MILPFNQFLLFTLIPGTIHVLFADEDVEIELRANMASRQTYKDEKDIANYTRPEYQPRHVHLSYGSNSLLFSFIPKS